MNRGKLGVGGDKRVLSFEFQLGVVVVVRELAKQHDGLEISKQDGGGQDNYERLGER